MNIPYGTLTPFNKKKIRGCNVNVHLMKSAMSISWKSCMTSVISNYIKHWVWLSLVQITDALSFLPMNIFKKFWSYFYEKYKKFSKKLVIYFSFFFFIKKSY